MSKNIPTIEVEIIKEPNEWIEPDEEKWGSSEMLRKGRRIGMTPEIAEHYLKLGVIRLARTLEVTKKDADKGIARHISFFYDKLAAARKLCQTYPIFYDSAKNWWIWSKNDYRWLRRDDVDLLNLVNASSRAEIIKSHERNEIINALKSVGRESMPIQPKNTLTQYKNKIVDALTGKEEEASSKYFFTNPIPWEPGISEDTLTIDKLLDSWVDEKDKLKIYEYIAYCTLPDMPINEVLALVSDGGDGKDQLVKIIKKFLDGENFNTEVDESKKNCVAMSISELEDKFTTSRLYKKLVVEIGEIDDELFKHTAMWKALTGGSGISGQFKGRDSFSFINYAKPIIHTNHLPETKDTKRGYYRRWLIVKFIGRFDKNNPIKDIWKTVPNEEYRNLARKSIRLLRELLIRGKFTNEGTMEEKEDLYKSLATPIGKFIEDECEVSENLFSIKEEFDSKFAEWCRNNKRTVPGPKSNTLALKEKEFKIIQKLLDKKLTTIILGLKLKNSYNNNVLEDFGREL